MELPRSLARFNKRVANPVQRVWAPWLPPWAVIVHKGRKSGRTFQTPVLSWRSGDKFWVVLFYGEHTDWVRNVLAAGEAGVRRRGRTATLTGVRVLDGTDPAVHAVPRRVAGRRWRVLAGELSG